jgi:phosphoglycolate phosphatase-like HAD superfamily hydrolase
MIKAVIFDVDGVLLDSFEAGLKFFQDLLIASGYEPHTREEHSKLFHLTMKETIRHLTKSESEEEINKIWEMGKIRAVPYPLHLLKMPKDSEKTVIGLSKKYFLAIVTSRVKTSIYEFPKLAALEKYFKATISYQDTVNHKPHPEPLLLAASRLGVEPDECVYVGDLENDLTAARNAGMKFILYSKKKLKGADACTSSFKALPELINKL